MQAMKRLDERLSLLRLAQNLIDDAFCEQKATGIEQNGWAGMRENLRDVLQSRFQKEIFVSLFYFDSNAV